MRPGITVITVTHNRFDLLQKAAASVSEQCIDVPVEHLIIGDECPALENAEAQLMQRFSGIRVVNIQRVHSVATVSMRLAALRNRALAMIETEYVAYLDDDNTYQPDHLASLLQIVEHQDCDAAHSFRVIIEPDGTLFQGDYFPWVKDPMQSQSFLDTMIGFGVLARGSSVMRDTIALPGDWSGTVDTSEWLIRTEVNRQYPWCENVSPEDEAIGITEDGAWLRQLVAAGLHIGCSGQATLLYRLGGRSNPLLIASA